MRIFLVVAALATLAPRAMADPFCDTLKTVIAAAPDQFGPIRGQANHSGLFRDPLKLPGARDYSADGAYFDDNACRVRTSNYEPLRYSCSFIASSLTVDAAGEVERMVMRVADCLAVTPAGLRERAEPRSYSFVADGVVIHVLMTYHMHGGGVLALVLEAAS